MTRLVGVQQALRPDLRRKSDEQKRSLPDLKDVHKLLDVDPLLDAIQASELQFSSQ
ncbi:hypothetical protein [Herbidospora mongoliensis]|uniref:hypothetical protein n=1 Tax=Herbidospora mongoliensis TaxID=688067 RepID=UPI0012F9FE05|nr:hypothetical protein [Herbidospora mongoliensis]